MAKQTGVHVREFLKIDQSELREGLKTDLNVIYEDGVVIPMTYKEIIVQRYMLDIFKVIDKNKKFKVPIRSGFCISNFYTNGILTSKTLNKCFETILSDVIELVVKPSNSRDCLPGIYEKMYDVFNDIYNDLLYNILEYSNSINIHDFLEIQFEDELLKSMSDVVKKKTPESVTHTYDVLDKIIRGNEKLKKDNIIARGYISGSVNANQVKQLLASRGYVTELNSSIFSIPVASSFTLGMQDIYDLGIESRAGAKALYLSNKAVQDSEYFARELQLITMIVERLVDGDCGNHDYMDWYVRDSKNGGKSDLPNLIGKYYFNPKTGQEDVITEKDKHLEGTTIKLRVAINCKLKDDRAVCSKCFGDLYHAIHKHTNIGHFCSTEMTEKLTQSILSTKHLSGTASGNTVKLDDVKKNIFTIKSNNYYFKPNVIKKGFDVKLLIDMDSAFGLKDLNPTVDVHKLNPTRISKVAAIILQITNNKTGEIELLNMEIKDNNKYGILTYSFLNYALKVGYTLDDYDRYVIDMNAWDYNNPFIVMPEFEYNFLNLARNIKSLLRNIKVIKGVGSTETPESLLQQLFDLVNFKLDVNIAMLDVIIYAMTVRSIKHDDFNLGRNSNDRQLMKSLEIITNRSLGAGYAWQDVVNNILSPKSYYGHNAIDHPLDIMIKPNEVMKHTYGDNK